MPRVVPRALIAAAILLAQFPAGASPTPADGERLRDLASRQEAAMAAGKAGRAAFLEQMEAELASHPEDALLLAWTGSARSLKAIDAPLHRKLVWLRKAQVDLDEAVARDPGSAAVRLTRAMHGISLPKVFGRRTVARGDFEVLFAMHESGALQADPVLLEGVRREGGRFFLEEGDARSLALLRALVDAKSNNAEDRDLLREAEDRFGTAGASSSLP